MKRSSILCLFLAAAPFAHAQVPSAPGAELKLVAEGFKFTEGPAVDREGNVYTAARHVL